MPKFTKLTKDDLTPKAALPGPYIPNPGLAEFMANPGRPYGLTPYAYAVLKDMATYEYYIHMGGAQICLVNKDNSELIRAVLFPTVELLALRKWIDQDIVTGDWSITPAGREVIKRTSKDV